MENIDWGALGFNYVKTDYNARYTFTAVSYTHLCVNTKARFTKLPSTATSSLLLRA